MKIELVEDDFDRIECDALVLPLFEDDDYRSGAVAEYDAKLDGLLSEIYQTEEWKGEHGDCTILYRPHGLAARRLVLIGGGKRSCYDSAAIRELTLKAVHRVKGYNLQCVAIFRRSEIPAHRAAQAAVEGAILGTYDGDDYKTEDKSKNFMSRILFVSQQPLNRAEVEQAFVRGKTLGESTNFARQLINEPGNRVNPTSLAEQARTIGETYGLEVDILGEPEMEEEGMGAALAVARGSDEPARFIILRHMRGKEDAAPLVLIGKGVTFDSGGYSLKPPSAMEDMKNDKAGACAVLAAMRAIAQLELKDNVIALIPCVENMVSGRAQRPGDIVRSLSGKTVEVMNTDAEGRLILADALFYAQRYEPRLVVDVATLTGACIVALAHIRAGLFSNDDEATGRLFRASERSGERLWRLPLDSEYRKLLDSPIADLRNVGGRWGGAVSAAKFLEEFVGGYPWCHLDIAGVDQYHEDAPLKGSTGFGVRTLVELALNSA